MLWFWPIYFSFNLLHTTSKSVENFPHSLNFHHYNRKYLRFFYSIIRVLWFGASIFMFYLCSLTHRLFYMVKKKHSDDEFDDGVKETWNRYYYARDFVQILLIFPFFSHFPYCCFYLSPHNMGECYSKIKSPLLVC